MEAAPAPAPAPAPSQPPQQWHLSQQARSLLAYKLAEIDPGHSLVDEGQARLEPLLLCLFEASSTAPGLLQAEAPDSLAGLIAPSASMEARQTLVDCLLGHSEHTPQCALRYNTRATFNPTEADLLSERERQICVAIKKSDLVLLPTQPAESLSPTVCLRFPQNDAIAAGAALPDVLFRAPRPKTAAAAAPASCEAQQASLEVVCAGRRKLLRGIPGEFVQALFALPHPVPQPPNPELRLPAENELPDCLAEYYADVWQRLIRVHALFDASREDSTRPLSLDSVAIKTIALQRAANAPRVRVVAKMHPACCRCMCPAWKRCGCSGLSYVTLEAMICGQKRNNGSCPIHGSACIVSPAASSICCSCLELNVVCWHVTNNKARAATNVRIEKFSADQAAEISCVLALAASFQSKREKLAQSGGTQAVLQQLEDNVRFSRNHFIGRAAANGGPTPEALSKADCLFVKLMRRGGVSQAMPRTKTGKTAAPKIVNHWPGEGVGSLSAKENKLKDTHYQLFPTHSQCMLPEASAPTLARTQSSLSLMSGISAPLSSVSMAPSERSIMSVGSERSTVSISPSRETRGQPRTRRRTADTTAYVELQSQPRDDAAAGPFPAATGGQAASRGRRVQQREPPIRSSWSSSSTSRVGKMPRCSVPQQLLIQRSSQDSARVPLSASKW